MCKNKTNRVHRLGKENERCTNESKEAFVDCWKSGLFK